METIKMHVELHELDSAIEKANRLILLLGEAKELIGSLAGGVDQKSNDAVIASEAAASSISFQGGGVETK